MISRDPERSEINHKSRDHDLLVTACLSRSGSQKKTENIMLQKESELRWISPLETSDFALPRITGMFSASGVCLHFRFVKTSEADKEQGGVRAPLRTKMSGQTKNWTAGHVDKAQPKWVPACGEGGGGRRREMRKRRRKKKRVRQGADTASIRAESTNDSSGPPGIISPDRSSVCLLPKSPLSIFPTLSVHFTKRFGHRPESQCQPAFARTGAPSARQPTKPDKAPAAMDKARSKKAAGDSWWTKAKLAINASRLLDKGQSVTQLGTSGAELASHKGKVSQRGKGRERQRTSRAARHSSAREQSRARCQSIAVRPQTVFQSEALRCFDLRLEAWPRVSSNTAKDDEISFPSVICDLRLLNRIQKVLQLSNGSLRHIWSAVRSLFRIRQADGFNSFFGRKLQNTFIL